MSAMYSFLFDRKSLTLLICGFVVGGGLLFFSGVLVGVYWSLPYGTEIQATAPLQRPLPRPVPARVPSTAPPPAAVPEPAATPAPAPPARRVPDPAIELPSEPPVASEPIAEEAIGLPKAKAVPAAPVPAPAPAPAPRTPRRSRPVPAPEPAPPAGTPQIAEARYSIQVGAYSQLTNSQATMAQLARRGYAPYVVEVQGSRGVLHMVRVGRYPDRGTAARAASDFRRKERMEAIVAPLPREQAAPAVEEGSEKASATSG